jgi:hypothetical protein
MRPTRSTRSTRKTPVDQDGTSSCPTTGLCLISSNGPQNNLALVLDSPGSQTQVCWQSLLNSVATIATTLMPWSYRNKGKRKAPSRRQPVDEDVSSQGGPAALLAITLTTLMR